MYITCVSVVGHGACNADDKARLWRASFPASRHRRLSHYRAVLIRQHQLTRPVRSRWPHDRRGWSSTRMIEPTATPWPGKGAAGVEAFVRLLRRPMIVAQASGRRVRAEVAGALDMADGSDEDQH